jgi:hypothetical protein
MNDGDYTVRMVKLPGDIHGAVRLSDDGFANIYINDQLAPMAKRKAFDHEKKHIDRDDFYNDLSIKEVEECHGRKNRN